MRLLLLLLAAAARACTLEYKHGALYAQGTGYIGPPNDFYLGVPVERAGCPTRFALATNSTLYLTAMRGEQAVWGPPPGLLFTQTPAGRIRLLGARTFLSMQYSKRTGLRWLALGGHASVFTHCGPNT